MNRDPNPVINVPHTLTVQYQATELNGTTESIPFSVDPGDPDFLQPNAQGIFNQDQKGPLGLIDPDQGVGGSMGDRFIPWFEVCVDSATTVTVSLVDAEAPDKNLRVLEDAVPVDPDTPLYRTLCFRVPQGGLIKIETADPVKSKVRLRIIVSIEEECDDDDDGVNGRPPCCDCHSFSSQRVQLGANDLFVGFSSGWPFAVFPPPRQWTGAIGQLAFGPDFELAACKCVCRDGRFVGAVISASFPLTAVDVFVEVQVGGAGPFVRTVVAAGIPIGTTPTIVPFPPVPFKQGDCIRMGITPLQSAIRVADLKIELELEYT